MIYKIGQKITILFCQIMNSFVTKQVYIVALCHNDIGNLKHELILYKLTIFFVESASTTSQFKKIRRKFFHFQTLGILLVWKSPSDGVKVQLDLSITLLNRENFSENRSFRISAAEFEARNRESAGNRNFIKIAELLTHRPR